MTADTHPEADKPENEQTDTGQPSAAPSEAGQTGAAPAQEQAETAQTGPKAYVDPSIAAEATIAELEARVAEMQDRYVRAVAETDNVRKRSEREKADVGKYAVTKFAGDMVTIADNLRRAIAAATASAATDEQSGPLQALLDGVALTDQELQKALEKNGVRLIAAEGEIFNPHRHQAVMEQDNPSVPAGTIMQVFQDGYQIEDRVLRPAMVVVAKGGAKPVKSTNAAPNLDPAPADSAAETAASPTNDNATAADGEQSKPEEPPGAA